MAATKYTYSIANDTLNGAVVADKLDSEIRASEIVTALDFTSTDADVLDVWFKDALSAGDETTLGTLVAAHDGVIVSTPSEVQLSSPSTAEDSIPIMYPSPKPQGFQTVFMGGADNATIGKGTKCLFNLADTDASKVVDFVFSENVYIKDGFMIVKDAPFGACVDIDVVHPVSGDIIGTFARNIPIFGTGWFHLDTNDRALIPAGVKLRIAVYNADGTGEEDAAAAFKCAGRFETYRPEWGGAVNK